MAPHSIQATYNLLHNIQQLSLCCDVYCLSNGIQLHYSAALHCQAAFRCCCVNCNVTPTADAWIRNDSLRTGTDAVFRFAERFARWKFRDGELNILAAATGCSRTSGAASLYVAAPVLPNKVARSRILTEPVAFVHGDHCFNPIEVSNLDIVAHAVGAIGALQGAAFGLWWHGGDPRGTYPRDVRRQFITIRNTVELAEVAVLSIVAERDVVIGSRSWIDARNSIAAVVNIGDRHQVSQSSVAVNSAERPWRRVARSAWGGSQPRGETGGYHHQQHQRQQPLAGHQEE
jgi:hypothetical protein